MNEKNRVRNDRYGAVSGMFDISSSHCGRFSQKNDFSMFNMADYMSCDNCRHNTCYGCAVKSRGTNRGFE